MFAQWLQTLGTKWENGELFVEAVLFLVLGLASVIWVVLRKRARVAVSAWIDTWAAKAFRFWPETIFALVQLLAMVVLIVGISRSPGLVVTDFILACMSVLLAIYVPIQEYRFARKAAYSEVVGRLHMIVHNLRDRFESVDSMTEEQFVGSLREALDGLGRAFSIATRTNCRASVKVISTDDAAISTRPLTQRVRALMVKTLARDSQSAASHRDADAEFLDDNEDFKTVFSDATQRCFFENNLIARSQRGLYFNSHLPEGFDARKDEWPLPYRATVVWPVRKVGASAVHPDHHVLGFLCVDAPSRNVFARRYDFDVGALVADALYTYIKARLDALDKRRAVLPEARQL